MEEVCDKYGCVIQDDASDGTTQVRFMENGITAWLPTVALTDVEEVPPKEDGRLVKVADLAELRPAVENIATLKWHEKLEQTCGQHGVVIKDDVSDGTSQVRFSDFTVCSQH